MRRLILAAAIEASLPAVASAQETPAMEAYVGLLGGGHVFDRQSEFGSVPRYGAMNGQLLEAVGGVNLPLGDSFFVGAEGNVAKGIQDIDWEYGAKGRFGLRSHDGGLLYVSAGHQWVNGRRGFADHHDWSYGFGVEMPYSAFSAGTGKSPRLRFSVDTYDFDSIRPMAGIVFGF
jgi:hypothetical protein